MSYFSSFANFLLLKALTFWKLFLLLKALTLFLIFFSVLSHLNVLKYAGFLDLSQTLEDFQGSFLGSLLTYNALEDFLEVLWQSLLPCLFFITNLSVLVVSMFVFLHWVTFCCLKLLPFENYFCCSKLLPYFEDFLCFEGIWMLLNMQVFQIWVKIWKIYMKSSRKSSRKSSNI